MENNKNITSRQLLIEPKFNTFKQKEETDKKSKKMLTEVLPSDNEKLLQEISENV